MDTDTNNIIRIDENINESGWFYSENSYIMSKLYVENKRLFIEIGMKKVEIMPDIRVEYRKIEKIDSNSVKKELLLYKDNTLIAKMCYIAEFGYSFWNPFDNEDETEEEEDWGLFLSNILQSEERRLNIINLKSE